MTKTVWVLAIAAAFFAGTIVTGTMAYAASNAQGEPFQQLRETLEDTFQVDSFFDVMYDIELSSDTCPPGDVPKLTEDLAGTSCVPQDDFRVDSFFDVFFDVEVQTDQNTEDIDTIETEIVSLDLRGQSCPLGQVVTGVSAEGELVCTPIETTCEDCQLAFKDTLEQCLADGGDPRACKLIAEREFFSCTSTLPRTTLCPIP